MKENADWIYWGLLAIFIPLMISHMSVEIGRAWVQHRSRSKALDVLRSYAEKGQEPPASVIEALIAVGSGRQAVMGHHHMGSWPAPPVPTREKHLSHVAANAVGLAGAAWIAWWRMPAEGEPMAFVNFALVAAVFFACALAARLVGVFTTPSGWHRDDR